MGLQTSPHEAAASQQKFDKDLYVIQRCKAARSLEEVGEHAQAGAALREFWEGVGTRPRLDGLKKRTQAALLLRAGTLTGWLGQIRGVEEAQERAKDLIGESIRIYESLRDDDGIGEARTELAYCYWRTGELNEARALLEDALRRLRTPDLRAVATLRMAIVDCDQGDLSGAIKRLTDTSELFLTSTNKSITARFHYNLGTFNKNYGLEHADADALDRASIEFAGAAALMEEIGHKVYLAFGLNQLGFLLVGKGEYAKAHENLDRARVLCERMKARSWVAQVDETRARAFIGEGQYREAELAAAAAVRTLKRGEARGTLAEALTTLGKAQARLGKVSQALASFFEAREVAEHVHAGELAAVACVTAIEEIGASLRAEEVEEFYKGADVAAAPARLRERLRGAVVAVIVAARRKGEATQDAGGDDVEDEEAHAIKLPSRGPIPEGFSLSEELLKLERVWLRKGLREHGGNVSPAARALGLHHGTLTDKLKKHPQLRDERTPERARRKKLVRV
jgi:tetratricopeptide (TPR) repeat protein